MAIIRYPDPREELPCILRSVWFGMIFRVVRLKLSASSWTNKLVYFDITVLVYATVPVIITINLLNPTHCISVAFHWNWSVFGTANDSRFRCSSFLAKVKNIIQNLEYYENDNVSGDIVDDYDYEARARTLVNRQHQEQLWRGLGWRSAAFLQFPALFFSLVFARGRNNHIHSP